jgi:hypothetical protein
MKGYFHSNLDRPSKIRWLGGFPSTSARSGRTEPPGRHGCWHERTQARATVHHLRRGFSLCDLHTRGIQFAHLPRWKQLRESRRWESGSSGGDGIRWCSGSKGFSGSGGVVGGSSSKRRIGVGVSGAAARRWRRGSTMAVRVWAKFAWDRVLLIGGFAPNHRRQKS